MCETQPEFTVNQKVTYNGLEATIVAVEEHDEFADEFVYHVELADGTQKWGYDTQITNR